MSGADPVAYATGSCSPIPNPSSLLSRQQHLRTVHLLGQIHPLGRAGQAALADVDRLEAEFQGWRVGLEPEVDLPGSQTSGRPRWSARPAPASATAKSSFRGRSPGRPRSSSSCSPRELPLDQLRQRVGLIEVDDVAFQGERAVRLLAAADHLSLRGREGEHVVARCFLARSADGSSRP